MVRSTVKATQSIALMLARIAVGVVLVTRGWHRWMVTGVDEQARILAEAAMPAPELLAWLVTIFELAGGVLLIFGLGTPIVGLGIVVLALATGWMRRFDGHILRHEGGIEYYLVLAAVGLLFTAFGSGKLGADALFFTPKESHSDDDGRDVPSQPLPPEQPREHTVFSQEPHS